jgi:hypothetical protein
MIFGTEEFNERLLDIVKQGARHPNYQESVDHAEVMSWHFYGVTPERLLMRARPNEDPEITKYRIENYEPHTKAAADKSVNITSKIFNPNLYSIRWEKDKDNANAAILRDYTLDYYPGYNSLVSFTKDVLLRKMLADPNAVAAVKPDEIPEAQTETLEPVVTLYGSANVWDYDKEHYLIFLSKEKYDKLEFYKFEYYDEDQFITFEVAVKDLGKTYRLVWGEETIYPYGFEIDAPPVWQLQGLVEAKDDGSTCYKSFFHSAVPFWNDAITHESDLKGSFIRHLFPQKYEVSEQCRFRYPYEGMAYPCQGGKIKYGKPDGQSSIINCPHCQGSGFEPIGPYGVYRIQKEKLTDTAPLGIDPIGYINVPTDATKMLDERVDKLMKKGMWAINMDVEDEVGQIQSGAAKAIDRSAQYDMLYTIGCVVFDVHLQNMFYFINKFKFGVESQSLGKKDDENLPQINKPTMFDILSTAELMNNFKIGKESGLDTNFLVTKQQEILSKDLTTNPDLKMFNMLLLDLDPLAGMSDITIGSNVRFGFTAKKDAVIHFNIRSFVERAMREKNDFVAIDKSQKIVILDQYAQEFIKANKVTLDPNLDGKNTPTA